VLQSIAIASIAVAGRMSRVLTSVCSIRSIGHFTLVQLERELAFLALVCLVGVVEVILGAVAAAFAEDQASRIRRRRCVEAETERLGAVVLSVGPVSVGDTCLIVGLL